MLKSRKALALQIFCAMSDVKTYQEDGHMPKKYGNPPLIEAVCEFRVLPDSPWDLTVHGLIYEKIKESFPYKEQRLIQEFEMNQGPKGIEQQVRVSERSVFLTDDKTMFVQIGPHLLAINCLKPYPRWERFKPRVEEAFNALTSSTEVKGLARIGHRVINRIEIPSKPLTLQDYFEFRPLLGNNLPQNMVSFILGCILPFKDKRDFCKIQLTNGIPDISDHSAFLLDFDYFSAKPDGIQASDALVWIEEAHRQVNDIFEGCITNRLREIFQEEK
jgi:uncharacterized protein (TIGR04255 family)